MAESSALTIAMNVFTSPSAAFTAIKERGRVWFPLLLLLGGYAAVNFLYLNKVDMGWFMENQLAQGAASLTAEQRAQAVERAAAISPVVYGAIGAVTTSLFFSVVLFLVSLYYSIVSF